MHGRKAIATTPSFIILFCFTFGCFVLLGNNELIWPVVDWDLLSLSRKLCRLLVPAGLDPHELLGRRMLECAYI